MDPGEHLLSTARILAAARTWGPVIDGADVLEVGTGRRLTIALGLWLAGAASVTTVDLHAQLKDELLGADLDFFRDHRAVVVNLLGSYADPAQLDARLGRLLALPRLRSAVVGELPIRCVAPADAAGLALADQSVDLHVSRSVLEHIPLGTLTGILRESRRVLRPAGLFVHVVDFSDHFSHSDATISGVHFLQWPEERWARLAGCRFNCHNRLRVDDIASLIEGAGLAILETEPEIDPRGLEEIRIGMRIDGRFAGKAAETLATANAWFIARGSSAGRC
jgi:SAM-dependent methyltransferase